MAQRNLKRTQSWFRGDGGGQWYYPVPPDGAAAKATDEPLEPIRCRIPEDVGGRSRRRLVGGRVTDEVGSRSGSGAAWGGERGCVAWGTASCGYRVGYAPSQANAGSTTDDDDGRTGRIDGSPAWEGWGGSGSS